MLAKVQPVHWVSLPLFDQLLNSFVGEGQFNGGALPRLRTHLHMEIDDVVPQGHFFALFRGL